MDDEDDWDLDYTKARVQKIKNAKIMQLKETCDELPDKKTRLAAGLKEIDAEYAARIAGIEANVLRPALNGSWRAHIVHYIILYRLISYRCHIVILVCILTHIVTYRKTSISLYIASYRIISQFRISQFRNLSYQCISGSFSSLFCIL